MRPGRLRGLARSRREASALGNGSSRRPRRAWVHQSLPRTARRRLTRPGAHASTRGCPAAVRSTGTSTTSCRRQSSSAQPVRAASTFGQIEPSGPRHHKGLRVEDVPLVPHPGPGVGDPVQAAEVVVDLVDHRMRPGVVEGRGPGVHQVGHRAFVFLIPSPKIVTAMNSAATASSHHSPRPMPVTPMIEPSGGHPVGLVHVGVGVEHLVVQVVGELHLEMAQDHRRDSGDHHRADHQPAEPEHLAEQLLRCRSSDARR